MASSRPIRSVQGRPDYKEVTTIDGDDSWRIEEPAPDPPAKRRRVMSTEKAKPGPSAKPIPDSEDEDESDPVRPNMPAQRTRQLTAKASSSTPLRVPAKSDSKGKGKANSSDEYLDLQGSESEDEDEEEEDEEDVEDDDEDEDGKRDQPFHDVYPKSIGWKERGNNHICCGSFMNSSFNVVAWSGTLSKRLVLLSGVDSPYSPLYHKFGGAFF
ncbi:hypothetical protein EV356DRAFT_555403 [Viridothelium virens]|uniref:Uncharacterized protein n=1 Tax=Viridothelium virens TaxID=1048519 RepID=A0A6A6GW32_VIRVR|nr:hypothetical protein EV356DRAFT_555403 [Viridothelium virens]